VRSNHPTIRRAFSLVELVIVIIILAVIAAIVVPRVGRAGQGSAEATLKADLRLLREVIELYKVEHNNDVPALRAAGGGVGPQNGEAFNRQLTWLTSRTGEAVETRDTTHSFGPYLRSIPPLPVGKNAGKNAVSTLNAFSTPGLSGAGFGWEYEHYFGRIRANCTAAEVDSAGIPYYQY
jgi:prepilin-type N-terminal cleavage/methylation domain-containing protein